MNRNKRCARVSAAAALHCCRFDCRVRDARCVHRSIAVNMKTDAGQRLVQQLAAAADVVVENFLPGAASRMNISYDHVRALNPRAIYVSVSGYGGSGPLAHHPVPPPPAPCRHLLLLTRASPRATISWRRLWVG